MLLKTNAMRNVLLIVFGLGLIQCNEQRYYAEFYKRDIDIDLVSEDTICFEIFFKQSTNKHVFQYVSKQVPDNNFSVVLEGVSSYIEYGGGEKIDLLLLGTEKLKFGKDSIVVKRFTGIPIVIDGSSYYYISDELGLVMRKHSTWNSYFQLITLKRSE
jgi:hypothetical protein